MPDAVLDMRLAHYLKDFAEYEGFLQARQQEGLQVEKKKALKQAPEQMKGTNAAGTSARSNDRKKIEGKKTWTEPNRAEAGKLRQNQAETQSGKQAWWGAKDHWASKWADRTGVPQKEQKAYFHNRDDCWRCGRPGYRTFECFSFNTVQGTLLPKAPGRQQRYRKGKGS